MSQNLHDRARPSTHITMSCNLRSSCNEQTKDKPGASYRTVRHERLYEVYWLFISALLKTTTLSMRITKEGITIKNILETQRRTIIPFEKWELTSNII